METNQINIANLSALAIRKIMRFLGAQQTLTYIVENLKGVKSKFIVHFFNLDGEEVGYHTIDLNVITIFKTPRIWSDKFKQDKAYKWGHLDLWESQNGRVFAHPEVSEINLDTIPLSMLK